MLGFLANGKCEPSLTFTPPLYSAHRMGCYVWNCNHTNTSLPLHQSGECSTEKRQNSTVNLFISPTNVYWGKLMQGFMEKDTVCPSIYLPYIFSLRLLSEKHSIMSQQPCGCLFSMFKRIWNFSVLYRSFHKVHECKLNPLFFIYYISYAIYIDHLPLMFYQVLWPQGCRLVYDINQQVHNIQ